MPTLFRLIVGLALIAGLTLGAMIALVAFVQPQPREMVEIIPPSRLQPR